MSPIGQEAALIARLGELRQLPRPVYGQLDSPPNLKLGLGGLYAFNFVPEEIEPVYGGDPNGAMAFVRLKLD